MEYKVTGELSFRGYAPGEVFSAEERDEEGQLDQSLVRALERGAIAPNDPYSSDDEHDNDAGDESDYTGDEPEKGAEL